MEEVDSDDSDGKVNQGVRTEDGGIAGLGNPTDSYRD
jgi:hypothetical protein